jgi:hypothetical protein
VKTASTWKLVRGREGDGRKTDRLHRRWSLRSVAHRRWIVFFLPLLLMLGTGGCNAAGSDAAIGVSVLGGTLLLSQAPGQELEQVYYLGIFDPREQLPNQVYRVTVHGQASAISGMKFGSGWLPASLVDSLATQAKFEAGSDVASVATTQPDQFAHLETGRRLMLFGPEGFREAPKDYRLVIVMGASPEAFFNAIDSSLGAISAVRQAKSNTDVVRQLADARSRLQDEQDALNELQKDVVTDLPMATSTGGTNESE